MHPREHGMEPTIFWIQATNTGYVRGNPLNTIMTLITIGDWGALVYDQNLREEVTGTKRG